jgi:ribosomal protein S16
MRILGIDFTSKPRRSKPITCLEARLEGAVLHAITLHEWHRFDRFEAALAQPGPWIAGIDFPFGLPRRFIENIGRYHPMNDPSLIEIDEERALHWLGRGAQPSDPVRVLLQKAGIWEQFRPGEAPRIRQPKQPKAEATPEPGAEAAPEPASEPAAGAATGQAPEPAAEAEPEAPPTPPSAEEAGPGQTESSGEETP